MYIPVLASTHIYTSRRKRNPSQRTDNHGDGVTAYTCASSINPHHFHPSIHNSSTKPIHPRNAPLSETGLRLGKDDRRIKKKEEETRKGTWYQ
jgi:hypothetical protein